MAFDDPEILDGDLLKVVSVNDDGTVFVRYQDDRSATVTGIEPLPQLGDIIFVGFGHWRIAPPEAWQEKKQEPKEIGIVRRVLADGDLIVETISGLKTVPTTSEFQCAKGHTIEFNAAVGVLRLLSETPVGRLRDELDELDESQISVLPQVGGLKLGFEDFGGFDDVVAEARELVESQFKYRKFADKIGARPLRGILFAGPPGTGKTHLARIIAKETKADFYLVDGPSLVSKWVGSSERALRDIFAQAEAAPSGRAIIFFDEIDTIAERRTDHTHEMSRRLVGQFLTLMDGFKREAAVIVIAATNRPEALDPALMRPGRFDRQVTFRNPTAFDRLQILRVGAATLRIADNLPSEDVATLTEGWSAADLALIWTEAGQAASHDERSQISAEDMVVGYERATRRIAISTNDSAR